MKTDIPEPKRGPQTPGGGSSATSDIPPDSQSDPPEEEFDHASLLDLALAWCALGAIGTLAALADRLLKRQP